jgi:hypothetical protein
MKRGLAKRLKDATCRCSPIFQVRAGGTKWTSTMNEFRSVSAEQPQLVDGGLNYPLWNNGSGVIFLPTGIA